jgi:hypothetical protein
VCVCVCVCGFLITDTQTDTIEYSRSFFLLLNNRRFESATWSIRTGRSRSWTEPINYIHRHTHSQPERERERKRLTRFFNNLNLCDYVIKKKG